MPKLTERESLALEMGVGMMRQVCLRLIDELRNVILNAESGAKTETPALQASRLEQLAERVRDYHPLSPWRGLDQ